MNNGFAVLLASVALGACHRTDHAPRAGATEAGSVAPPAASAAMAPHRKTPMPKEYAETPADHLGTLPDGVGIKPGAKAPDAAVENSKGQRVRLTELYAKGPVLLVFYRGGWCPFCNFQIRELSLHFEDYKKRGVTPVAISVDRVDEASATAATYTIPFPVLSDPDLIAHRAFHVVHHAADAEVTRLSKFGIDLEHASGKAHHSYAIPSIFLVDQAGVVRWAHADPDYKVRPKTAQLLAVLDAHGFKPR